MRNILRKNAQNSGMSKKKIKKLKEDLFEGCASANECTGLYSKVSLDTDEVAKYHKQYTEDD